MLEIGQRVRVKGKRWIRGNAVGTIIEYNEAGENHWRIRFDEKIVGHGVEGDKLWLNESELEIVCINS